MGKPHGRLHENGTGPFKVIKRQPKVQTTLERYKGYWNKGIHSNVTEVLFQPIAQGSARSAALVGGELEIVMHVPFNTEPQLANEPREQSSRTEESRVGKTCDSKGSN